MKRDLERLDAAELRVLLREQLRKNDELERAHKELERLHAQAEAETKQRGLRIAELKKELEAAQAAADKAAPEALKATEAHVRSLQESLSQVTNHLSQMTREDLAPAYLVRVASGIIAAIVDLKMPSLRRAFRGPVPGGLEHGLFIDLSAEYTKVGTIRQAMGGPHCLTLGRELRKTGQAPVFILSRNPTKEAPGTLFAYGVLGVGGGDACAWPVSLQQLLREDAHE